MPTRVARTMDRRLTLRQQEQPQGHHQSQEIIQANKVRFRHGNRTLSLFFFLMTSPFHHRNRVSNVRKALWEAKGLPQSLYQRRLRKNCCSEQEAWSQATASSENVNETGKSCRDETRDGTLADRRSPVITHIQLSSDVTLHTWFCLLNKQFSGWLTNFFIQPANLPKLLIS